MLPVAAHDLGMGPDTMGAFYGLVSLTSAALQLPTGILSDRFGRRPLIVIGLLATVASQVLRVGSFSAPVFALSLLTLGLAMPLVNASAFAAVADTHGPLDRPRALGVLQTGGPLGQAAGLTLGALLGPLIGWRQVALVPLLLTPILLLLALRQPDSFSPGPAGQTMASRTRELMVFALRIRGLQLTLVTALASGAGVGAVFALPFVARTQGLGAGVAGLLLLAYLAGAVASSPLAGALISRFGPRRPLAGMLLSPVLIGALLVPFHRNLPLLALGLLSCGSGVAATRVVAATSVVEMAVGRAGVGSALATYRLANAAGPAISPALMGAALVSGGAGLAFGGVAAAYLATLILALPAIRRPF